MSRSQLLSLAGNSVPSSHAATKLHTENACQTSDELKTGDW